MNTKDNWTTTATIHDAERRELWSEVFPGARVPIKSIIPVAVNVPERGVVPAYMLDLDALTEQQLDGVASVIAKRFGLPIEEVRSEIHLGVPIVVENLTISTSDPTMANMMIGRFEASCERRFR